MSELDEAALVEINTVRRRQLVNAVAHGTGRSWTSARRRLPALVLGLVLAVLVLAGVAITQVVQGELANRRSMSGQTTSGPSAPTPTTSPTN